MPFRLTNFLQFSHKPRFLFWTVFLFFVFFICFVVHFLFSRHITLCFLSWCIDIFYGLPLFAFFFNHPISSIFAPNFKPSLLGITNIFHHTPLCISFFNMFNLLCTSLVFDRTYWLPLNTPHLTIELIFFPLRIFLLLCEILCLPFSLRMIPGSI